MSLSARRVWSVGRKELRHILRDPMTLMFTVLVPLLELFLLGYAIDTRVRNVRTIVLDQANTQESRALLSSFESSGDFAVIGLAASESEVNDAIVAGRARVGLKIPADYSRRLEQGTTASLLVLVDGSESSVAAETLNVANALALRASLEKALGGRSLAVEARPRVLFNPDTRSANFFIPGLMVIICQMMATLLSATAVVREKENGTLEQLFMTPVRPGELLVGKMLPYVVLTTLELCVIALLMTTVFGVPVHGSFLTLLALAEPFVLTMLGVGLAISTRASTRDAAIQLSVGTILPSVFLSGYIFPVDSMPEPLQYLSRALPTTWLIDASRGVILRGGGWAQLWPHALVLWGMAGAMLLLTATRFRKRLS
jgi:ABC-2 type transport system permease protein